MVAFPIVFRAGRLSKDVDLTADKSGSSAYGPAGGISGESGGNTHSGVQDQIQEMENPVVPLVCLIRPNLVLPITPL